jgi:uncharacterized membrane protein
MTKNSNQPSKSNFKILLGGVIGLILGILGNLISGWIQNDLIGNVFTIGRLIVIFVACVAGIVIAYLLDKGEQSINGVRRSKTFVDLSAIRLWWSTFKIKGKGISANNIFSVGSEIDINSDDKDNKG